MPKIRGNFWSEYEVTVDSNEKEKYACKTCSGTWSKNTSRLKEHIKKCKDINVETETLQPQGTKCKRQQTFDEYKFAFTSKDQIILESLLIRAFCSVGISFNVIENEDFILFLKKACPSFKIPSHFTLSNTLLDQEFEHLELVVNSALSESPTYCLISDGWSNIQKTSIVNCMISTPKPLFFKATAFKEERHTAENIALGLETTMKDAGINKFGAIITDNASNMKAAWKILKQKYPKKIFLGCWAHGIHLWMKDIISIEWIKEIIEKAKKLSIYFRNHQRSSYSCINQLFLTKSAIRSTIAEDHLNLDDRMKSLISSDTFWNNLGKIQNFLENFAIFIKKLEGDETFLSTAYFEYQQLKAHVRNNTDLPENIREEVKKFGTNRWQNFLYNPVVIVAYKLDLRYCGSRLNARIFDPIIEKEILSLVGEEYKDIVLTELAEYVRKTGSFAHSHLWGDVIQKSVNWWNLMKGRYPILSDIAIQILFIPATSAASERNWSTFGFIHSKLRNKLHKKRVEKIVYMFWNLRILRSLEKALTIESWVEKVLQKKAIREAAKGNNEQEIRG
ncbi:hypothetical protein RirG_167190 [Rhizophagus irregularis DAOM 197198w]|uniref:Zinc finger bed domain-containing protein 1-like n=2 Tax=Rhizophagus irregularis TaxID=588596 RepID=A0A015KPX7_RHIIW|nr:hypothetical protein RirG_167190 [Rhizophagus irregularis DAOM 197198w]